MKPRIFISTFFILFATYSFGQSIKTDSTSKLEISKLDFITGNWKGTGWMMKPDGTKSEFEQTEKIEFKLDSTAILIEGKGKSGGTIIHNALAIISYDREDQHYTFQSYLHNGRKGQFKAELIRDKFFWYPNEKMRYIITLNDQGQWFEIGEYNRNGSWYQFFEMTLDREP